MKTPDLSTRIRAYLAQCPAAISKQGGHNRAFTVACSLLNGFSLTKEETYSFLSEWNKRCQPEWTETELRHKIDGADSVSHDRPRGHLLGDTPKTPLNVPALKPPNPKPKWPEPGAVLELIKKNLAGVADLWEMSPVRLPEEPTPEFFIDLLFPGNPLLCMGRSSDVFATTERLNWAGKEHLQQFIVPSPMSKTKGKTKDGRPSQHCLDNTGPRRFIVIEFDTGSPDLQASVLLHLAKFAPFVMAVSSGGKSVHGWFFCADKPEKETLLFFRYAVSLGADRALWTRSQFVRVPDGTRDTGATQSVYYFNPKAIA